MADLNGTQKYSLEDIFGENSESADLVLQAQEHAIMKAKTLGEIRRITRMAQAKLRSLRTIQFSKDRI